MSVSVTPTQRAPTGRLAAMSEAGFPCAAAGWCRAQRFRSLAGCSRRNFTSGAVGLRDQGRQRTVRSQPGLLHPPRLRSELHNGS